ncbi:hypothetical protein B0H16DRAFT_1467810 [Mycena metata]|uniref:Chitin-binding type-3 domain-containing protein n=1 Tax=Mycena metata TaxID=1033252 RepID=A0AAD7I326_9AGAR|nr:hypothetical protein B0H16DRAFT_1467810 [Mycena metata]
MARFSLLACILCVLLVLSLVAAVPVSDARLGKRAEGLSSQAREVLSYARAIDVSTSAPQFVAYFDKFVSYDSMPDVSLLTGFTVFALAFVYPSSAVDNAQVWESMTAADRATTKAEYNAAGISLIVSAFGSGSSPTSQNPTTVANYIANYVRTSPSTASILTTTFDDSALESAGTAIAWLSTLTTVLRQQLPQGQILIHAPFYNQGASEYVTCAGLLTASSSVRPESALFQIAANGVPLNKLVIGKGATGADATNGYIDPATLAGCVAQAKSQGWSAGVMEWQYPNGGRAWIEEVRAGLWPVGGGGGTTTTSTTTKTTSTSTSTTSTSTGSGGSRSVIAAWSSSLAYPAGSRVTYSGSLWTANQWNDNEVPGGAAAAWNNVGACTTAAANRASSRSNREDCGRETHGCGGGRGGQGCGGGITVSAPLFTKLISVRRLTPVPFLFYLEDIEGDKNGGGTKKSPLCIGSSGRWWCPSSGSRAFVARIARIEGNIDWN